MDLVFSEEVIITGKKDSNLGHMSITAKQDNDSKSSCSQAFILGSTTLTGTNGGPIEVIYEFDYIAESPPIGEDLFSMKVDQDSIKEQLKSKEPDGRKDDDPYSKDHKIVEDAGNALEEKRSDGSVESDNDKVKQVVVQTENNIPGPSINLDNCDIVNTKPISTPNRIKAFSEFLTYLKRALVALLMREMRMCRQFIQSNRSSKKLARKRRKLDPDKSSQCTKDSDSYEFDPNSSKKCNKTQDPVIKSNAIDSKKKPTRLKKDAKLNCNKQSEELVRARGGVEEYAEDEVKGRVGKKRKRRSSESSKNKCIKSDPTHRINYYRFRFLSRNLHKTIKKALITKSEKAETEIHRKFIQIAKIYSKALFKITEKPLPDRNEEHIRFLYRVSVIDEYYSLKLDQPEYSLIELYLFQFPSKLDSLYSLPSAAKSLWKTFKKQPNHTGILTQENIKEDLKTIRNRESLA